MTTLLFMAGLSACMLFGIATSMTAGARRERESWLGTALLAAFIAVGAAAGDAVLRTARLAGVGHPEVLFRDGCFSGMVLFLAAWQLRRTVHRRRRAARWSRAAVQP